MAVVLLLSCFLLAVAGVTSLQSASHPVRRGAQQLTEEPPRENTTALSQNGKSEDGLGAVVAQLVSQLSSLKDKQHALEVGQLTTKSDLQSTRSELQSELQSTKSDLQSTKSELQSSKSELQSELQSTKSELQSTKSELQSELQSTKSELQSTKSELQSELQSTKSELQSTKSDLQSTKSELNSTKSDLQSTKSELQSELLSTKSELQSTKSELQSTKSKLQSELQSTKSELQSTKSDLQSTKSELQSELQATKSELQSELQSTKSELQSTKSELQSTKSDLQSTKSELQSTKSELQTAKGECQISQAKIETKVENLKKSKGSSFVRWGRKTCPNDTTLVYSGLAGGKHPDIKGSGTNILCLTRTPQFDSERKPSFYGTLYGGKYEFISGHHKQDVPCSVCLAPQSTTIMVPATLTCPPGWTPHYTGHLVAQYKDFFATEYVCLDGSPEDDSSEARDDNGLLLYFVVTVCGTLPCPPYTKGKVVTCVVCSK